VFESSGGVRVAVAEDMLVKAIQMRSERQQVMISTVPKAWEPLRGAQVL
jgi:hypothetical protein